MNSFGQEHLRIVYRIIYQYIFMRISKLFYIQTKIPIKGAYTPIANCAVQP